MRIIAVSILAIWVAFLSPKCGMGKEFNSDAVIESENIITKYTLESERGKSVYIKRVTTKRKIKIKSLNGLERLNKLYIPTFTDLDYSYKLVHVFAKTVKKSGEEFVIEPDRMQETTLPGNLISLYGFDGKVLQFAFENVQVGDVIEYNYTMEYETSKTYGFWDLQDQLIVSGNYPILEGEYVFKLQNNVKGMFAISNSSREMDFNEEDNTFRVKLYNIA